jgi:hypothetical protein
VQQLWKFVVSTCDLLVIVEFFLYLLWCAVIMGICGLHQLWCTVIVGICCLHLLLCPAIVENKICGILFCGSCKGFGLLDNCLKFMKDLLKIECTMIRWHNH